jgi:hypothetical protein
MVCYEVVEVVRQRTAETSSNYLWWVSVEDVDAAVDHVIETAGLHFEHLWGELDGQIQQILTAAAPSGSTDPYELTESMEDQVQFLGIMEQVDGRWRFKIELFRRWILQTKMTDAQS